jgi:hypothetical protein
VKFLHVQVNGLSYLLASLSRFSFQIYYFHENIQSTYSGKKDVLKSTLKPDEPRFFEVIVVAGEGGVPAKKGAARREAALQSRDRVLAVCLDHPAAGWFQRKRASVKFPEILGDPPVDHIDQVLKGRGEILVPVVDQIEFPHNYIPPGPKRGAFTRGAF